MLRIFTDNSANHPNRREFLEVGSLALGGWTLSQLLAVRNLQAVRNLGATDSPKEPGTPGDALRDVSIVLLFLTGGPSQIETFDPKMTAPAENRSVTGEVKTKLPGVTFGGTFPEMARYADRMAIVRSFSHGESNHTKAVQQVIRGGNPINAAGMGAIATSMRGTSHPRTGMPTHVYLSADEVDRQFDKERLRLLEAAGPGGLGGSYGPFQVGGSSDVRKDMKIHLPQRRLHDRVALRKALDGLSRRLDRHRPAADVNRFEQQALELILGRSRAAFDLSREHPRLVERYDTSRFVTGIHADRRSTLGQQLLLARRLCEAGCGFITVHNPGWDMHGGPTQFNMPGGMETLGRPVDRAVSAFLEDLKQRGLSDKILLIVTGEFGRTVRVKENGGRDHWPHLSTLAFAGGGLRMGQVIGQSNSTAAEPLGRPVTLPQLFATVMHAMFDIPRLRSSTQLSREITSLLDRGQPIAELF